MKNLFPTACPSCRHRLAVTSLECTACQTTVVGRFALPELAALSPEDREFTLRFVLASGSLKQIAQHYGVSYPTVRNRLDDIIAKLHEAPSEPEAP